MIKAISEQHIPQCVSVIRDSFSTVADSLGFTAENAPGFTAFATTPERLRFHMFQERRPMYAFFDGERITGYYSLLMHGNGQCELSNLCVLPASRHRGLGKTLLMHAFDTARALGCTKVNIGIVEENKVLRAWYESYGFIHLGTKKPQHLPFTCGFLEKQLL